MKALLINILLCVTGTLAQDAEPNLFIQSDAPSIRITFDQHDPRTGLYLFTMYNDSPYHVLGVHLNDFAGSVDIDRGSNGTIPPAGKQGIAYSEDQLWKGIHLTAAVFADGHCEGDPRITVPMAASLFGTHIQVAALRKELDGLVSGAEIGPKEKGRLVKSAVDRLPEAPRPEDMVRARQEFPSLASCDTKCQMAMTRAMRDIKRDLPLGLTAIERGEDAGRRPIGDWVKTWWPYLDKPQPGAGIFGNKPLRE